MMAFFEATWFFWWIFAVIAILRWFNKASEYDHYLDGAEDPQVSCMVVPRATRPGNQPNSLAS